MSLAQAILEFLLEGRRSMTLFATHYHELTALAGAYPQLFNAHMAIHERTTTTPSGKSSTEVTFLHQLLKGPANKSYGIHVARLAGLPASVTKRAASLLKRHEAGQVRESDQMSLMNLLDRTEDESGFDQEHIEESRPAILPVELKSTLEDLKKVDLTRLTPLEALNQISKWQSSLAEVEI